MFQRKTCASLAVILALAAAPALAQQAQHEEDRPGAEGAAAAAPSQMGPGMMGGGMPMMGMMSARASHVEGRVAFLKTELKITDAQLPLWNAVADAMRESAKATQAMAGGMMGMNQSTSLPDRLAAREKGLAAQLEATRKLKAAVDPLYAVLSDEQKKAADELTGQGGMLGGGTMGMMGGGMHPGDTRDQGMMGGDQRGGIRGRGMRGAPEHR